MSALRGVRGSRGGRRLWLVGATLVAAAAFGAIFVAGSGAAPATWAPPSVASSKAIRASRIRTSPAHRYMNCDTTSGGRPAERMLACYL